MIHVSYRIYNLSYTPIFLYRILFDILLFTCGKDFGFLGWKTGKRPTSDSPQFEICHRPKLLHIMSRKYVQNVFIPKRF